MTGCGSFSGVGCQSPSLGIAQSAPAPHVATYVPHIATHVSSLGGLPMTGADIRTIALFGAVTVFAGLVAMAGGKKHRNG